MTAIQLNAEIYRTMGIIADDEKLDIINRLSAALMKKSRTKKADMSFFDGLTNAWDDDATAEEEVERIY